MRQQPSPAIQRLPSDRSASFDRAASRRPVGVQLDDVQCAVMLRITEDAVSYGVIADFDDVPPKDFEVELAGNKLYIHVRAVPFAVCRGPGTCTPAECSADPGSLCLAFDCAIDVAASSGECSDGLLHLSLRKQGSSSVPQRAQLAAAPAGE